MAAASLNADAWHAIDAPFDDVDGWYDGLAVGVCTACGGDAWSGRTGWWHDDGARLYPERHKRTPGFSPDP